jgi:hypothetical protein
MGDRDRHVRRDGGAVRSFVQGVIQSLSWRPLSLQALTVVLVTLVVEIEPILGVSTGGWVRAGFDLS